MDILEIHVQIAHKRCIESLAVAYQREYHLASHRTSRNLWETFSRGSFWSRWFQSKIDDYCYRGHFAHCTYRHSPPRLASIQRTRLATKNELLSMGQWQILIILPLDNNLWKEIGDWFGVSWATSNAPERRKYTFVSTWPFWIRNSPGVSTLSLTSSERQARLSGEKFNLSILF